MSAVQSPERGRGFLPAPTLRFGPRRPHLGHAARVARHEVRAHRAAGGLFRPRRRPMRVLGVLALDLLLLVAIVALGALGIGPHVANYRTLTMLTASMRPSFPPGSIVVVSEAPVSTLRAGDVITFHAPTEDRRVVTHRVVGVRQVGPTTRVITKGDANNANDPWGEFTLKGSTVWKARGDIPLAGHALANLRRPQVQLAMTRVIPLLLMAWLLICVWRRDDAPA